METTQTVQPMSERYALGALLTVAGGFLDAYTYLTRGRVFATAQTGNLVLAGLRLVEGQFGLVVLSLIPVLAYALGVLAAEYLRGQLCAHPRLHWRQAVLGVECLLLLIAAFLPSGERFDPAVNIAVSFISALQMQSFRTIQGNVFASTMCTGNLRSGSEALSRFLRTGDHTARTQFFQYYAILLFFVLGTVLSAGLTHWLGVRSVLFCVLLLAVAITALSRERI